MDWSTTLLIAFVVLMLFCVFGMLRMGNGRKEPPKTDGRK